MILLKEMFSIKPQTEHRSQETMFAEISNQTVDEITNVSWNDTLTTNGGFIRNSQLLFVKNASPKQGGRPNEACDINRGAVEITSRCIKRREVDSGHVWNR